MASEALFPQYAPASVSRVPGDSVVDRIGGRIARFGGSWVGRIGGSCVGRVGDGLVSGCVIDCLFSGGDVEVDGVDPRWFDSNDRCSALLAGGVEEYENDPLRAELSTSYAVPLRPSFQQMLSRAVSSISKASAASVLVGNTTLIARGTIGRTAPETGRSSSSARIRSAWFLAWVRLTSWTAASRVWRLVTYVELP